jgi:multidrug efflux pump subunit AcrA (membrane-fusion protein)
MFAGMGSAARAMWGYRSLRVGLPLVLAAAAVLVLVPKLVTSSPTADAPMYRVERKEFVHEVIQRGTLESASNVDIRCEVHADDWMKGTQILEVAPEGTYVQPGDVLVRLDSSAREEELTQQQLDLSAAEADMVAAQNDLINAQAALREYVEGAFVQDLQDFQAKVFSAEEDLRQAKERYSSSEKMFRQGFISQLQLQADSFAVERAEVDLEVAKSRLRILKEFTRPKKVLELENKIKTADVRLQWRKYVYELRKKRMAQIEEDIKKCTIRAPSAGQVVYANDPNYWLGPVIIEDGAWVRERQVIIRLPDPKRMVVKTNVTESRVSYLRSGMKAEIRLDARRDVVLPGTVEKVNDYPLAPSRWSSANVQEYEATIHIDGEPAGLRPGLTAEVKICLQRLPDQLQVPVDAVFEHNHRHFCIVAQKDRWQAREVKLGPSNGQTVVIREGLQQDEQVAAGAGALRKRVQLPALEQSPQALAATPAEAKATASPARLPRG